MLSTRCLAAVAVISVLSGCSDERTTPSRRSKSRTAPPVAASVKTERISKDQTTPSSQVVQTAHVELERSAMLPSGGEPSMLDEALGTDDRASHQEASEVLTEAIKALRTKMAVISHNMANADTIAFKRSRVELEDCGYRYLKLPGAQDAQNNYAPVSIAVGHGCRVQSVELDLSQGTLQETGRPLDVAIEGEGFFQLIDPTTNNFVYTRAGNFAVNANGVLVIGSASTGRVVQPQFTIPIDTTGVLISADGNVSIQQFGQTQFSQIGQLQMAKFLNPQGLLKLGENLYQEALSSGAAIFGQPGTNGLGTLRQKALERSNVDLDEELLEWQTTERTIKRFERLLGAATL